MNVTNNNSTIINNIALIKLSNSPLLQETRSRSSSNSSVNSNNNNVHNSSSSNITTTSSSTNKHGRLQVFKQGSFFPSFFKHLNFTGYNKHESSSSSSFLLPLQKQNIYYTPLSLEDNEEEEQESNNKIRLPNQLEIDRYNSDDESNNRHSSDDEEEEINTNKAIPLRNNALRNPLHTTSATNNIDPTNNNEPHSPSSSNLSPSHHDNQPLSSNNTISSLEIPEGLSLLEDEEILKIEQPSSTYNKNVIIVFFFGIISISLCCFVPFYFLQNWRENDPFNTKNIAPKTYLFLEIIIWFIYLSLLLYVCFYRLLYCKLLIKYIITTQRLIICKGYYPFEQFLTKIFQKLNDFNYLNSWSLKDEIEEIVFTLHKNNNNNNCTIGSIYFGHKIDKVYLPFSIITQIVNTGFISVSNVYELLDLIIKQCNRLGNNAIQHARLINQSDDPALRPYIIEKSYALCGFSVFCCFKRNDEDDDVVGYSRRVGKISHEEFQAIVNF
ncbi:hypothetical protein ABK040_002163 [Willaertia magna]